MADKKGTIDDIASGSTPEKALEALGKKHDGKNPYNVVYYVEFSQGRGKNKKTIPGPEVADPGKAYDKAYEKAGFTSIMQALNWSVTYYAKGTFKDEKTQQAPTGRKPSPGLYEPPRVNTDVTGKLF